MKPRIGAVCVSPHKLKQKKNKKTKGTLKMVKHLKGAFHITSLTLVSNWETTYYLTLLPRIGILHINSISQQQTTAAVLKGIAAVFLLAFTSWFSTFSPGCRSPPFLFVFCKNPNERRKGK